MKITLKDLDIRYKGIRAKSKDKVPNCSFKRCTNPIDYTEGMGWDTTCSYHRLLFDYWLYNVIEGNTEILKNRNNSRKMFNEWVKQIGKNKADKIVVKMVNDGIIWECYYGHSSKILWTLFIISLIVGCSISLCTIYTSSNNTKIYTGVLTEVKYMPGGFGTADITQITLDNKTTFVIERQYVSGLSLYTKYQFIISDSNELVSYKVI